MRMEDERLSKDNYLNYSLENILLKILYKNDSEVQVLVLLY